MSKHTLFRTPINSPDFRSKDSSSKAQKRKKIKENSTPEKDIPGPSGEANIRSQETIRIANTPLTAIKSKETTTSKKELSFFDEFESSSTDDISPIPETESEDSFDKKDILDKTTLKLPYTFEEDKLILKFVLLNENIFKTGSILLWKKLECKMVNPRRTYQSLKNRFLRNIKPRLFTTYRHLIPDSEAEEKILLKFPELKNSCLRKTPLIDLIKTSSCLETFFHLSKNKPPDPDPVDDNFAPSTSAKENLAPSSTAKNNLTPSNSELDNFSPSTIAKKNHVNPMHTNITPLLNIFGTEPHIRKVSLENKELKISFRVYDPNSECKSSQNEGIYEKYLRHKKNNILIPCPHCGRCGFDNVEREDVGNDSTDDEGRLIIDWSYENSPRKSQENKNSQEYMKTSSPIAKKKRRSETPKSKTDEDCSPSLLSCSYRKSRSKTPDIIIENSTPSKEKSKNALSLEDIINDMDLKNLYDATVANSRMFMDSDEEEKKENLIKEMLKKNPKSKCLQPIVSLEKINVESFFFNSDWPGSSGESLSSSENVFVESTNQIAKPDQNVEQTQLAKNMMKMLKK